MGQQCVRDTCQRDSDRSNELVFGTVGNSNGPIGANPNFNSLNGPGSIGQPYPSANFAGNNGLGNLNNLMSNSGPMVGLTPGGKPPLITPNATVDIFVTKDELGRRQGYGRIEELGYQYEGQFRDDYKEGSGTLTWPDGRQYAGQFLGGKFHGKAVMVWADGRRYDGEYIYGRKHGYGIFSWPDGRRYVGEWYDGRRHGKGTYTNARKETRTGFWENDRPTAWEDQQSPSQMPTVRSQYGE